MTTEEEENNGSRTGDIFLQVIASVCVFQRKHLDLLQLWFPVWAFYGLAVSIMSSGAEMSTAQLIQQVRRFTPASALLLNTLVLDRRKLEKRYLAVLKV